MSPEGHREPPDLAALLGELGLMGPADWAPLRRRLRRLGPDVPQFEAAWIDELAAGGRLTPLQAAELHAGRGAALRVGPYVLLSHVQRLGYAEQFTARPIAGGEPVWLFRADVPSEDQAACLQRLEALSAACAAWSGQGGCAVCEAGRWEGGVWAAAPVLPGRCAGDVLRHVGRFPPEAVLELARQLAAQLAALERMQLVHGDLRVENLWIDATGQVALAPPGLRAALRPAEWARQDNLSAERCAPLAAERLHEDLSADAAGDLFACGCLWWHLLAGRPPHGGGNLVSYAGAVMPAGMEPIGRVVPDTPATLACAVDACVRLDAARRLPSAGHLAAMLGGPTRQGQRLLADSLRQARPAARPRRRAWSWQPGSATAVCAAAAAGAAAALLLVRWWYRPTPQPPEAAPQILAAAQGESPPRPVRQPWPETPPTPPIETPHEVETMPPAAVARQESGELVLAADKPTDAEQLRLEPGMTVRAPRGRRAAVRVPLGGWTIAAEDVRFENIDFFPAPRQPGDGALLVLHAGRLALDGCTLVADGQTSAIAWRPDHDAPLLPSGEVRLRGCLARDVAALIDADRPGALSIRLDNVLHQGPGGLVRLRRAPGADEPIVLQLRHVTLHAARCVLDLPAGDSLGPIAVRTEACVLAPASNGGLLRLRGQQPDETRLRESLQWTGEGSVLAPDCPLLCWDTDADGGRDADPPLRISGMVRGRVAFAGSRRGDPADWRVIGCEVPLLSESLPGIRPEGLFGDPAYLTNPDL